MSYQTRLPNPKAKEISSGPFVCDSSDATFDMWRSGMNIVGLGYFSGLRAIDLSEAEVIRICSFFVYQENISPCVRHYGST